jgi:ATP-dependent Clp protease protease subunit
MAKKIYVIGDIDEEAYETFSKRLTVLEEKQHEKALWIRLELNSSGGSAIDAIAFYDRMRFSPFNFVVTVYGCAYSAAVLILAGGDHRRMSKNSWVMVHEDEYPAEDGVRVSRLKQVADHGRRLEDQWNELMSSGSDASPEEWAKLHKAETYLSAEECLGLGLIEEII